MTQNANVSLPNIWIFISRPCHIRRTRVFDRSIPKEHNLDLMLSTLGNLGCSSRWSLYVFCVVESEIVHVLVVTVVPRYHPPQSRGSRSNFP
jgi:hypothetical protein